MRGILLASVLCSTLVLAQNTEAVKQENTKATGTTQKEEVALAQTQSPIYNKRDILEFNKELRVSVIGQGVAPLDALSPAQAYAMAKRAAIGDAYRLIAEKVKGVHVEGQDVVRDMILERTDLYTYVNALVKNANVVESTYKEGLCEVEMEIVLSYASFTQSY